MTHADNRSPAVPQHAARWGICWMHGQALPRACVQHPSSKTQSSMGSHPLLGHQSLNLSVLKRVCGWTVMSPGCQQFPGLCTELEKSLPQQWGRGWRHTGVILSRFRGYRWCKLLSQDTEHLSLTELACPALLSPWFYPFYFKSPVQGDIPGNSGSLGCSKLIV